MKVRPVVRVHLDTDLGSDTDDLCALAMLLGWPDVELTGITTSADPGGMRAGMTSYALRLAGREGVTVVAGAAGSIAGYRHPVDVADPGRYWPEPIEPRPSRPGEAIDLLLASVEAGATLVAIGPWTNLGLLEVARPGTLAATDVVVMGGWLRPPRKGLPQYGPELDYNVRQDIAAARIVVERAQPVIVDLAVTLEVTIREADLPRLRAAGLLGGLLADQAVAHGADNGMSDVGRSHAGLPDDLLNFQYDVVAAAAAVGWDGLVVEPVRLRPVEEGPGILRFESDPAGQPARLVVSVEAERLREAWLDAAVRASAASAIAATARATSSSVL